MFKNNINKPNNPINEETFELVDMLYALSRKKNCDFSINFVDADKDWSIKLEDAAGKKFETEKKSSLENVLKEAIKSLKRWNF